MSQEIFDPSKSGLPAELASVFDADALGDDLSSGAQGGGFQVLSFRGSKWRVKQGGDEYMVLNADEEPAPSIQVVMLKANKGVSKIWYAKAYSDGDAETPDCFSVDGERPDPSSQNKQAATCAACPHNQWGSRITENGKKAKACSDSRRVAVILMDNVPIEVNDEPMLLRVPAASLADLATFGKKMQEKGYPYNAIVTRIGFDPDVAFPKLTFKAVRPITGDEAKLVAQQFHADATSRILSEPEEGKQTDADTPEPANNSVDTTFEDEEPAKKAPPKKAAKKKAAKKQPPPEAADAEETAEPAVKSEAAEAGLDDELDSIIAELEGLD